MDYKGIAEQILKDVGGPENIASYAHCATRLRLVLVDETKADKKAVEKIEAVAGSFTAGGQYQIILGPGTVNKVHDELAKMTHIEEASMEEVKKAAAANMNPAQRAVKTLSDIFVPLIPALVASGLMMGLFNLLAQPGLWPWLENDENLIGQWPAIADLAAMINLFANAAFVFLPVLIGFSAAKVFGANQYLGAVIGMIMVHPDLLNAWAQGQAALSGEIPTWSLFGWEIDRIGYQGTVLPVLFAVWFLAVVEKWLRKRMPTVLDMLFTPLFAVIATGFATILVIGPVMRWVGELISTFFVNLLDFGGPVAGFIMGATYSLLVITGVHHSFHAVELGLISDPAVMANPLLPIWSMSNVAQGGAALAAYFLIRHRATKIKDIAVPSAVSAFLGITEPAIFGVNLRLLTPFLGGLLGGGFAGAFVVATDVTMTSIGATGLPGTALVTPEKIPMYFVGMAISISVAMAATFAITKARGFAKEAEEEMTEEEIEAVALPKAKQLDALA
ncbi:MAG TPA: sucrose-specific PTS transporter subunit IIBC [Motilibacterales bacterium]|nr:sucrose-specific PTS transporter subunit IIBC [Motilibacterales bacterium]